MRSSVIWGNSAGILLEVPWQAFASTAILDWSWSVWYQGGVVGVSSATPLLSLFSKMLDSQLRVAVAVPLKCRYGDTTICSGIRAGST